jgi:MFS transporter, UMF1 family
MPSGSKPSPGARAGGGGFWARVGLPRPELRAWALYDWANSGYVTTVIAALFPIYFARVAAAGLPGEVSAQRFAVATSLAMATVALMAPFLGALADRSGRLKGLLGAFVALGVGSCAGLFFVGPGDWLRGLVLFGLGNVGITGSLVFYDALLRHLARDEELDRVSSAGYALGYLGGGVLLALQLAWVQWPRTWGFADAAQASRWAFLATALWWLLFSLPLLLRVKEPAAPAAPSTSARSGVLEQLRRTFRHMRQHPQALQMLLAYLLYSDGIGTIIRMATLYGTEVGIGQSALLTALLLTQTVGVPAALLLGRLAQAVGARRVLLGCLGVYMGVCVLGYFLRTPAHFYALAFGVGLVQGASQALSRSLFASMVPRERAAEFFAFFSVFEKVTAVLGPLVFALAIRLTGSSRGGILSILLFFALGALVLARIDVAAGQRAALPPPAPGR